MTSLAVLCRRPHSIRVYIVCDPAPFTVNIIHTSVSQSQSFAAVCPRLHALRHRHLRRKRFELQESVRSFTIEGILVDGRHFQPLDRRDGIVLRKKQ